MAAVDLDGVIVLHSHHELLPCEDLTLQRLTLGGHFCNAKIINLRV